jgi:putative DNA primase/helicase
MMYEHIPDELKVLPQWVCWQSVEDENRPDHIKKIPINPKTGGQAQSNNPDTWTTFDIALQASEKLSGIGFMFASGYFGVDIDDVEGDIEEYRLINGDTSVRNILVEFIYSLRSYAEFSVSGRGLHMICKGTLPSGGRRRDNVEMYEKGRFFVMTGDIAGPFTEIAECTETIKPLHEKYIGGGFIPGISKFQTTQAPVILEDAKLLELARASKQGQVFTDLYDGRWENCFPSQSEADMSLCSMLAFWTGKREDQMDRIFRSSGLMREKWDRRQAGSTYGKLTMQRACQGCTQVYDPKPQDEYRIIFTGNQAPAKKIFTFDDTGNAERLQDAYGSLIRYCFVDKKWMYYDDRKWCPDNIGAVKCLRDQVVSDMGKDLEYYLEHAPEGVDLADYEKQYMKHVKASRSNRGKTAMLKETEHRVPILPSQLDRYTDLLNTPNGIVQLRDGMLMPHNPEKYLSRVTHAEYTDTMDCPLWESFLLDIFAGNTELIRYIQKAVGYSISGSIQEQCAFFLYGTGKNGKSTFIDVLSDLLGDYAMNIQPETLMLKNSVNSSANSDVARLKGARFVTSVEPNEGVRLNEGLLKQLTGGDKVTARKLYGEEFEFTPEFKLWMATNHKPVIRGTDIGIWRRIHLIPFTVQIHEDKRDPYLKYKLLREAQGILKWAVDGCLMWKREGLKMPDCVLEAVKDYKNEMDVISSFMKACVVEGSGKVRANKLYRAYVQWAEENKEYIMSGTKFGKEIAGRLQREKDQFGLIYTGILLREDAVPYQVKFGLKA